MKIPEFYLAVASKLEVTNAQLGLTDRLIVHEPRLQVFPFFFFLISDNIWIRNISLQAIQGFHIDAPPVDMTLVNGGEARGIGKGFSAFLGLSKVNYMWIASLNQENNIVNEKRIEFNEGIFTLFFYSDNYTSIFFWIRNISLQEIS